MKKKKTKKKKCVPTSNNTVMRHEIVHAYANKRFASTTINAIILIYKHRISINRVRPQYSPCETPNREKKNIIPVGFWLTRS